MPTLRIASRKEVRHEQETRFSATYRATANRATTRRSANYRRIEGKAEAEGGHESAASGAVHPPQPAEEPAELDQDPGGGYNPNHTYPQP